MALLCSTTPCKPLLCNHDNCSKLLSASVDSGVINLVLATCHAQMACTVLQDLRHLWETVEGSRQASAMKQNLCLLCLVSLSTQLLALVHLLSRYYALAAYPECRSQNTTAISHTLDRCTCSGCHSWISFITVVIQAHPSLLPEHPSCTKITSH